MNRVAKLVDAAREVRRTIWASLPWGVRLAQLFVRLASGIQEAIGQSIYEEFAHKGVTGVPLKGDPHFKEQSRNFGRSAYYTALAVMKSPVLAEDTLQGFYIRFKEGGSHGVAGMDLKKAENYVLKGIRNQALNEYDRSRRQKSLTDDNDEGGGQHDLPVMHSLEDLSDKFPEQVILHALPKMEHDLKTKAHPDAPMYIKKVLLEGMTDKEFLKHMTHPMTDRGAPMSIATWSATYLPRIYKVVKEHLKDLAQHA